MGIINNIITGHKNLFTGKEIPQEKKRIKICESCNHFSKDKIRWCGKCPCNMKAKVKAPQAKCPIRKW